MPQLPPNPLSINPKMAGFQQVLKNTMGVDQAPVQQPQEAQAPLYQPGNMNPAQVQRRAELIGKGMDISSQEKAELAQLNSLYTAPESGGSQPGMPSQAAPTQPGPQATPAMAYPDAKPGLVKQVMDQLQKAKGQ